MPSALSLLLPTNNLLFKNILRRLVINTTANYERLCTVDVLGLPDSPGGDQQEVYREFREQLTRDEREGWCETSLLWKGDHPPLPNNQASSLRRLDTQVAKLR